MWYDVLMGSEGYRGVFSTATLNIIRAANLARSTRTPWAVRNLFRARDRGRLQLLLLHRLVAAALLRCGATGPLDELINSPDQYVEELAWLGITLDYALGTYLDRAEYLISEAYDAQTLELEARALALGATHPPREDSSSASSCNPLELIPSIQPNAPSA